MQSTQSDLVERYLAAIRRALPAEHAGDIAAELGDDIRQQMDDRAAELGRDLNEAEVVEILKQSGHPMLVAARYLPPRYVIGPASFPAYKLILKIVLGWVLPLVFALIVGPVLYLASGEPAGAIFGTAVTLLQAEVVALGIITLVFALIERGSGAAGIFSRWDPRHLPPVRPTARVRPAAARSSAIADIVFSVIAAAWIASLMPFLLRPGAAFTVGGATFIMAPVWRIVAWPSFIVALAGALLGWIGLMRPDSVVRSAGRLMIDLASGAIVAVLLNAATWVTISVPANPAAGTNATVWADMTLGISFIVTAVIIAADAIREAWRLLPKTDPKSTLNMTRPL